MSAFTTLARAQWLGFWREKQNIFWILLFPLMFLLLFGSIFRSDVSSRGDLVEVGQVQLIDRMPPQSRTALAEVFAITRSTDKAAPLEQLRTGDVDGVVTQDGSTVQLYYSRADPVKAATVQGTLGAFVSEANVAASGRPPTFRMRSTQVEDSSLKPIQYIAPGLLGWAVAMGGVFGASEPFVNWRNSKLLRRLRLAPIRTESLVASRAVVQLVIAVLQTLMFVGVGTAFFGLRLTGAWWVAIPLVLVGALAFMALGLIVGAVSKTAGGASGLANLVTLPMAFLSGSFIQLDDAPGWLLTVSRLMPLRHLNDGLLDVMVRGQPPTAAVQPLLILAAFGVVLALVAARLFRWEDESD